MEIGTLPNQVFWQSLHSCNFSCHQICNTRSYGCEKREVFCSGCVKPPCQGVTYQFNTTVTLNSNSTHTLTSMLNIHSTVKQFPFEVFELLFEMVRIVISFVVYLQEFWIFLDLNISRTTALSKHASIWPMSNFSFSSTRYCGNQYFTKSTEICTLLCVPLVL